MSAERKKVLEMLAEGKISAEDAERLLERLPDQASSNQKAEQGSASTPKKQRFMRIVLEKPGQDEVNIRIPLAFTRTGPRLLAVLPTRVRERLAELGIDFSALSAMKEGEWAQAIENTNVDIEKGNGKKVRIFCE